MGKVIYEPSGRAKEYAPLAVNLYRGCGHRCRYCYAPAALRMKSDEFHDNPQPRKGIIEALEKDAAKFRGTSSPVLLCFTCDPYQPINDEYQLTREAVRILNTNGIAVHILTKRGSAAERDFGLLAKWAPRNWFGVTLTCVTDIKSDKWEPYADYPCDRINALARAHRMGISTWVSLEPVLSPSSALELITQTHKYVDLYKVGRWNYDKRANEIDWPTFRKRVVDMLEHYGKKYLIKKDLAEAV